MNTLSLGFYGNILRILKLGETKQIISKDEIALSFNIHDDLYQKKDNDDLMNEFSDSINNVLNYDGYEPLIAGVLIDTGQTFLNVFPVDFNEEPNSINSHFLWELSNYFPDTYKNFNIKYYRLQNSFSNEKIDEALLIAIDKNKIELIKNLCNAGNIKIRNIDIDQFAVEKCLKENHQDKIKDKSILIIGCKNSRLDFSLIINEKLKHYDYENFDGDNFKTFLVNQINLLNSTSIENKIGKIFLYGEEAVFRVRKFLAEQFGNIDTEFITVSENDDTRFSPLYGLALKMFDSSFVKTEK
ncbi:MAG: pilus assembly protein PilM [Bacteroidota bacterium]|nr:pilus assembly protein PilM [Bacteroidota bacterium]